MQREKSLPHNGLASDETAKAIDYRARNQMPQEALNRCSRCSPRWHRTTSALAPIYGGGCGAGAAVGYILVSMTNATRIHPDRGMRLSRRTVAFHCPRCCPFRLTRRSRPPVPLGRAACADASHGTLAWHQKGVSESGAVLPSSRNTPIGQRLFQILNALFGNLNATESEYLCARDES